MLARIRAAFAAALIALALLPAQAADKAFERSELADAAIKLEAQIKTDAGPVSKPLAALRKDADAAFQKNDLRAGMLVLSQMVVAAPDDAATWLRLARTIRRIKPRDAKEKALLTDRAATAAYIAYQRAKDRAAEADGLTVLGETLAEQQLWRPALDAMRIALDEHESADLRARYETLRAEHGFRVLDYSVDSDATSPRACFQFSEDLPGKGVDFTPFVAVEGQDRPALSLAEKQLCVEGLKHGERYRVTLRAGLPSTVQESLTRSADYTIFVRDRRPFARFAGKAYVLPKTGQRGIPLQSVNTGTINIAIYRVGDRNLIDTILGYDFERPMSRYQAQQIEDERGEKVWSGELAVEQRLNAEVTTAFPIGEALKDIGAGVYVMTAAPKEEPGNDYEQAATQWFIVSDLGLAAYSSPGGIDVSVNSLASAAPRGDVELRLVARNNEVLATRRTDAAGRAHFEAGLARGEGGLAPAAVVAAAGGDYAFLSLKSPAFDLSDRGVGGRAVPAGLDAFVYTERGVYRSGETVQVTTLLRDARGNAALNVPLTLTVERPDGMVYRRAVVADQGLGGRSLSVPLVASAATGTWRVRAYTDPKRPAIGETTFLVEDYVPDRLEFDLVSEAKGIAADKPAQITVDGRFLYGAPASGLDLSGEMTIAPAKERAGYSGYVFGDPEEEFTPQRQDLADLPQTDADGKAGFEAGLDEMPDSSRPLEAQITVRMAESGGRAVERHLTLPIVPEAPMIGIKPAFSGRSLEDGADATFDVVMLTPDGTPVAQKGLKYELQRIESRYQWYRQNGQWQFEPIKRTVRVADGALDVTEDKPARLSLPVRWGRYRLQVSQGEDIVSALDFDAGFYAESTADTPDLLEIALDKPGYSGGDTMTVAVTARSAGRLTIDVVTDRLAASQSQDVQAGTANVAVPVDADWGTGAYVVATLRRPLDEKAGRMPGRAIGVQWFPLGRAAHTLGVALKPEATVRPNATLRVPVEIAGIPANEDARVVVAAVDVGILNLTGYKPPAPDDYYLGQRRLSAEIRDLYGQLIDGMQGARGQIRTGGDIGAVSLSGSPPTQPPLALYSGIVRVGPDGKAVVDFDIPAFAGTVRVMAVAWSRDKVGKASADVIVRDPVVLTTTLPRFLRTGDSTTAQLELDNVEGAAGDYILTLTADGPVTLVADAPRTLTLARKQRNRVAIPLTASGAGTSRVDVKIAGPDGFTLTRSYPLDVRPANRTLTRRTVTRLAPGETLAVDRGALADFVPGTGKAGVSVALSSSLDAAGLLNALNVYPFGCTEQLASIAMGMLYYNELAGEKADPEIDTRIRDTIPKLLARQASNGSFGLWGVGGEDIWLDAYVVDFLTRARERGFDVPQQALALSIDRLRNYAGQSADPKGGGLPLAYVLYVLARNGAAPLGDLRYDADVKLGEFATPIAKAQIAAALGMLGDVGRAERAYAAALDALKPQPDLVRDDYGSQLRDAAAVVTLAAEAHASQRVVDDAVLRIDAARQGLAFTSTQENAWLMLAARALLKQTAALSVDAGGLKHKGAYYRTLPAAALEQPFTLANTGPGTVQAVVSVSGAPVQPEPAASQGFKIERKYYTLAGDPADVTKAGQNDRFVVVLSMTEQQPQFGHVIVVDNLPAGLEIDNPHLVSSGETSTLSWIAHAAEPAHAEFRDDRFAAAFERTKQSPPVFAVAYVVRAVSPGRYVLPQASVEDMYRPDRFARTATGSMEVTAAK